MSTSQDISDREEGLAFQPKFDASGLVIQNLTRVTTFGSAQNQWASATVDPKDPNVFSFHQHIVAADVPTYTAFPSP